MGMTFDEVLAALEPAGEAWALEAPASWFQGRTLYGGLTAALALRAAELSVPELPPLRAAQIAFVGPAAGRLRIEPRLLRRGRSVTLLGVDVHAGEGLALRALLAFGAGRPSSLAATAAGPPAAALPDACPSLWPGDGTGRPGFTRHIDQRLAGGLAPLSGAAQGELLGWVRHADPVTPGMPALVALADGLPPASFTRFVAPAAISTLTWSFDLFDPGQTHDSDWVLLHARDDGVGEGYAGQDMAMWDSAGRPLLRGRQSVAIFA